MDRKISVHLPQNYDEAVFDAFTWVKSMGGTLIFGTKTLMRQGIAAIEKKLGDHKVAPTLQENKVRVVSAQGGYYLFYGPAIAAIDCSDLDMRRLVDDIASGDSASFIELRSYTKTVDTHPEWTREYQPETIDSGNE